MRKEVDTLFRLFRCAVFGETLDKETKDECSEKAELLYRMAKHHDLSHLVKYAFDINGVQVKNEVADFELIRSQATSVLRYEDLNHAFKSIACLFEDEKIPFVPLKGAVIRDLYPEPWMRTSCDIDILVHENDVAKAEKAVTDKLGYKPKGERNYHDISLYSDTGVHLELHFSIKENMKNIDALLERVWDYAMPKSEGSFEYVLSNEFLVFQNVAHMSYHVSRGGCGIKYFIDMLLLDRKVEFDRNAFEEMLVSCKIKRFYDVAYHLANVWFADKEHTDITLGLQKYLLDGGVYGARTNAIAANSQKKSPVSYIFQKVFMPLEQLSVKYPAVKDKPYLVPYYQVRRWISAIGRGGMNNVRKGLNANNRVSENEINEYSRLFENLGLKNE